LRIDVAVKIRTDAKTPAVRLPRERIDSALCVDVLFLDAFNRIFVDQR
jgi:hypothetical protein